MDNPDSGDIREQLQQCFSVLQQIAGNFAVTLSTSSAATTSTVVTTTQTSSSKFYTFGCINCFFSCLFVIPPDFPAQMSAAVQLGNRGNFGNTTIHTF